jgi:hypothetical protein
VGRGAGGQTGEDGGGTTVLSAHAHAVCGTAAWHDSTQLDVSRSAATQVRVLLLEDLAYDLRPVLHNL